MYTIAGSCSVEGTFTADKAVLKTKEEAACTKPSLQIIFNKLFPSVKVHDSTENFILPEMFNFEELDLDIATKEVKVKGSIKDSAWPIAERRLLLGDAKLTLEFTAGKPVTGMKDWKIHAVGSLNILKVI